MAISSLPVFFIVNPILDAIATYRILRSIAKLYVKKDREEVTSNVLSITWSTIYDIIAIFFGFFGLG
jgi:hypothetical protein